MYRYIYLLFGALLLVTPAISVADSDEAGVVPEAQVSVVESQVEQFLSSTAWLLGGPSKGQLLSTQFYHGLSFAKDDNLSAAEKEFVGIRESLDREGFRNAPEYSFELLRSASQFLEQGKLDSASKQVEFALLLSPEHPRVLLSAAGFYQVTGVFASVGNLFKAASGVRDYPLVGITLLLNAAIVLAVSLTLAFLLVSVVQLLRGGEHLVKEVGKLFPRTVAGLAGVVILPLCLVGPLFLGVLAALAVWSMLLSLFRPSCKYYAFVVAGILLLWAWLVPNARVVGIQTQLPFMNALEDLNAGNFVPQGEESLLGMLSGGSVVRPVILGSALVAQVRGDSGRANELYTRLVNDPLLPGSLQKLVSLNSAALLYNEGKHAEAKVLVDTLEEQGVKSFELFHNSSLIHMGLLETEKYRQYFEKANKIDSQRSDVLQLGAVDGVASVVAAKLVFGDFWALVENGAIPSTGDGVLATKLAESLIRGGTPQIMEILAAFTLLVGVIGAIGTMKQRRRRRKSTAFVANFSNPEGSALWCVLPAGYAIAGRHPTSGAIYLAVVIASVVLAVGGPMHLFGIAPVETSLSQPFFMVAGVLLLISTTWSLLLYKRSPYLGS